MPRRAVGETPPEQPTPPAPRSWVVWLGWGVVAAFAVLAAAITALPMPQRAESAPTLVYDRYGGLIATLQPGTRVPVAAAQIPYAVRAATIATEDATFYANFGINPAAIIRAALADLRAHAAIEGGSTITQQLAKNLFLTPQRTWRRKALEVLYTLRLEATHSKTQILTMYLNTIYYGEGAYGIGAAAEAYFAEPVWRLDLAQSALLAGIPASPQAFDPYLHPAAAAARQRFVLSRMAKVGFITAAQAARAASAPLTLQRGSPPRGGPPAAYFIDYALAEIGQHDPALEAAVRAGGYSVYTTLDPGMQTAADQDMAAYLPPGQPDAHGVPQPEGALVAIDPHNGAVRALVGGRNYAVTPYNRAVYAMRQPGSTFKAFLYSTAITQGYPVTARLFDGRTTFDVGGRPYTPRDYDGYSNRWITMREALADSVNVIAVKWAHVVGPQNVIATARRMGLQTPMQPTLPLVLGAYGTTPLQLADAYVPLANGGLAYPAWAVERVVDPVGRTVWQPRAPRARRALDPGVAYIVTSLLESVMTEGTGKNLLPIVGRPVAGKTGSTSSLKDAWFAGYTPNLVAVVWVGDDTPASLHGYGATLAGPVWAHFLADASSGSPPVGFVRPSDVRVIDVSAADGLLPNPTSPTVPEVFLARHAPTRVSPLVGTGGIRLGIIGVPGSVIRPALGLGPASTVAAAPGATDLNRRAGRATARGARRPRGRPSA